MSKMSLELIRKEEQASGGFNNGEIIENKPIGFPQDGGKLRPYSNLFYWAYAWTGDKESVIGLHPHKGFEIMSFVLKGGIEHYDTQLEKWTSLNAGDAQIIRSGNGISHSEKLLPNSAIFQIWTDPNLNESLSQPASYSDHQESEFPKIEEEGIQVKVWKGDGSPLNMKTEGITIKEYNLQTGSQSIKLDTDLVYSCYLLSGALTINDQAVEKYDFFIVREQNGITFDILETSNLFIISSPKRPSYKTYSELYN